MCDTGAATRPTFPGIHTHKLHIHIHIHTDDKRRHTNTQKKHVPSESDEKIAADSDNNCDTSLRTPLGTQGNSRQMHT